MSDLVARLNACIPEVARGEANIMKARLLQDASAELVRLTAENARLIQACRGLLAEREKLTRYGSPMAKAANERVAFARAALEATDDK